MDLKTNTIIGHRGCRLWMGEKNEKTKLDIQNTEKFNKDKSELFENSFPQENILEAFLKGLELGAEFVEMDVRRTRDGVLVVHHDVEINGLRIRGAEWAEVKIHAEKMGLVIEKLEEVLQGLEGKIKIDVELKESGYEKEVMSLILQYFEAVNFIVKSFLDESVWEIKKYFPTITCGLLLGKGQEKNLSKIAWLRQKIGEFFPWKRVRTCRADFIAPNWRLCIFGLHLAAKRRRIPVLVWTLNDVRLIRKFMLSFAVNGIITDQPGLALKIRQNL